MKKTNIIYFHSHDTGRYIEPYGTGFKSPAFQKIAEEGIMFRNAHCVNPTCSPSRAALLTGEYPHNNGMLGLSHRGWKLNDYKKHLVHTMKQNGYETVLGGMQHIAKDQSIIGYDIVLKPESMLAKDVMPGVLKYLDQNSGKPFFASIGFKETHEPFLMGEMGKSKEDKEYIENTSRYLKVPPILPDRPELRELMAEYQMSLNNYDNALKLLVNKLMEKGIYDDTIIICTTDHGIPIPGMKCTLTDHGTGVMLIIKGTHDFPKGQIVDGLVSHLDIYPTLCDILGAEKPARLQGSSLMPLIKGTADKVHDELFFEVNYHAGYEPKRAVRTDRYKYILRLDHKQKSPVFTNVDLTPAKQFWLDNGWIDKKVSEEYLYDLYFDPNEANNLAYDSEYAQIKTSLKQKLKKWMEETSDPILKGQLPHIVPGYTSIRNGINSFDSKMEAEDWNMKEGL